MSDGELLVMLGEVDEVLTRHGALLGDLVTVADRLLVTVFANVAEQQPAVDIEAAADNTLALIRRHILQAQAEENKDTVPN